MCHERGRINELRYNRKLDFNNLSFVIINADNFVVGMMTKTPLFNENVCFPW